MKVRHALIATALLAATPAEAAQYLITYIGTVSNGYDVTGEFGTPQSSLTGLDFTAVYTLTVPTAGAQISDDGNSLSQIYGGSGFGASFSPVSAILTIGNSLQNVNGEYSGTAYQANNFGPTGFDRVSHRALQQILDDGSGYYLSISVNLQIESVINDFLSNHLFTSSLDYSVTSGTIASGDFGFFEHTGGGANPLRRAYGSLDPTRITIAAVPDTTGAVPEPATWAMMIAGFGMIGGAMRRRRRVEVRVRYA